MPLSNKASQQQIGLSLQAMPAHFVVEPGKISAKIHVEEGRVLSGGCCLSF
jgi:hypothetical protein